MAKKKFHSNVKNNEVTDGANVGKGAIVRGSGFVYDRVVQQKIRHRAELVHAFCLKYYEDVKYWTLGTNRDEWDTGCAKAVHYFCKWLTDNGIEWIICLEQGTKSYHVHAHLIVRDRVEFRDLQSVWVAFLVYYAYKGKTFYTIDSLGKRHFFDGTKVPALRGRGKVITLKTVLAHQQEYFQKNPGSLGYCRFYHYKHRIKDSEHLANYLVKCCGLAAYLGKNTKKKGEEKTSADIEEKIYTHRSSNFLRQSLLPVIEQIREVRLKKTSQKFVYIRMRKRAFLASVYSHGWARKGLSDEERDVCDAAYEDEVKRLGIAGDCGEYPHYDRDSFHNVLPYMEQVELKNWEEANIPLPYMEKKIY